MTSAFSRAICVGLVTVPLASAPLLAQVTPDVIVADLQNTHHWGQLGDQDAYSVGTVACNIGFQDLRWEANNNWHPVIGQNLYRLKDGRIEQLGLSWLKHAFATVDSGICGTCPPGGTGNHLSPGCSDPYGAGLNGDRSRLGPRYQVNASTGLFPYPYDNSAPVPDLLARRIIVNHADVDPAQNQGALYFVEGQYITHDDGLAGNGWNNQSYRRVEVSNFNLLLRGSTFQQDPAIRAWLDHGNGVNQPDPDVHLIAVDVPGDGRFWLAAKASDNGNGTWHYEYAIQNLTSDRSGGSFTIDIAAGANVTGVGFKDVNYHSGEPWLPDDWNTAVGTSAITWSSPQTFEQNPSSNALRWGTLYNFWFDIDAPAVEGDATLGLFKPGTPASTTVTTVVPQAGSSRGDLNCDGIVNAFDIEPFLLALFDPNQYPLDYPDCDVMNGDINADGNVDAFDIEPFLNLLFGP